MTEITGGLWRLPRRPRDAHKGDFGRLTLICGSEGLTGAARLAGTAALRSGAGLVSLGVPRAVYPIAASGPPELMVFPLPDDGRGRFSLDGLDEVLKSLEASDACLIGPGLGRSEELDGFVRTILEASPCAAVLDADGINAVAKRFPKTRGPCIVTPHPGEYARLGGGEPAKFARDNNCVLVLKGGDTGVYDPSGAAYIYHGNNPGMASGGSGDVLAGIIASLTAQSLASPGLWRDIPLSGIACLAVYLHGEAGKICARRLGEYGMIPSDIVNALPEALIGAGAD